MSAVPHLQALGIMGGTFDPIHYGHLAVAEQAREALDLERILFVPAARPPHKRDRSVTSARHRAAMVELAIVGNPAFELSRIELDRPGISYAVDTVAAVASASSAEGRPEPVFILSREALDGFPAWREPERILQLCRVAAVPRAGAAGLPQGWVGEHFPGQEERFVLLDSPRLGHSATDIRARVASGRSIRYLVPPEVEGYIHEHHLYPAHLWNRS